MFPAIAETLLAMMLHRQTPCPGMTVALIWGLVVWLALFDFTLLFVMH